VKVARACEYGRKFWQILDNDISIETNVTVPTAVIEEQEDCIIVSHINKKNLTADDIARRKKILDDRYISLSLVKENVLPKDSKLNDNSLDRFLCVVRETSCFETQSVLYRISRFYYSHL